MEWTLWEDGESSFPLLAGLPFQQTCLMGMTKALSGDSPALRCGCPPAAPQGTGLSSALVLWLWQGFSYIVLHLKFFRDFPPSVIFLV